MTETGKYFTLATPEELEAEQQRQSDLNSLAGTPSSEFLTDLVRFARWYGWSGDYAEVTEFVTACFHRAGKEPPEHLKTTMDDAFTLGLKTAERFPLPGEKE